MKKPLKNLNKLANLYKFHLYFLINFQKIPFNTKKL